ncbi:hypothetical protein D3C85_1572940 [compost metagenome]
MDSSRGKGSTRATTRTSRPTSSRIGRLAATTMITKTNSGSVKLRVSMYSMAVDGPDSAAIATISAKAQTPKTASTSANRCQMPACGPPRCASRAKKGTEKV